MIDISVEKSFDLSQKAGISPFPVALILAWKSLTDFSLIMSNDSNEKVVIGYDKKQNQYFVDRTNSGKINFQKNFAAKHVAPRLIEADRMNISLIVDVSSVELFADDGLSVMTEIFFPSKQYNQISIQSSTGATIKKLEYASLNSIWP